MKIEWNDVFEELSPPPGGLETLQRRLNDIAVSNARSYRRTRRLKWAFAACTACLVIWLGFLGYLPTRQRSRGHGVTLAAVAVGNPALVRLGLVVPTSDAVSVPPDQRHRMAVERVLVDNPNVIYYRVAELPESGGGDAG